MKIGPVLVEPGLALAPMAGATSYPFRALVKEYGCGLVFSEMISARGLFYYGKRSQMLLYYTERERPFAFQLFGSDPAIMAEAAQKLESLGCDIIDLNLGCPTRKVVRNGEGGALMRDPQRCSAIFSAVVDAVSCPVTVKMRKGWDDGSANAPDIALRAEASGVKALTVHGRTIVQGYRGKADWHVIRQVKEAVNIPVLGNGDVTTPREASALIAYSSCDGVMIGRAALGNPWIFEQVRVWLEWGREVKPPSSRERVETALKHLAMLCRFKGEVQGVLEMRRHAGWYIKGLPGASETRQRLIQADSYAGMSAILRDYLETVTNAEEGSA